jgi:transposase-like protein
MECPYCKSSNIRHLQVHIIGGKKHICLQCNQSFITNKTENKNNNLIQIPHENNKTY